jgi:hypothetical protein
MTQQREDPPSSSRIPGNGFTINGAYNQEQP